MRSEKFTWETIRSSCRLMAMELWNRKHRLVITFPRGNYSHIYSDSHIWYRYERDKKIQRSMVLHSTGSGCFHTVQRQQSFIGAQLFLKYSSSDMKYSHVSFLFPSSLELHMIPTNNQSEKCCNNQKSKIKHKGTSSTSCEAPFSYRLHKTFSSLSSPCLFLTACIAETRNSRLC